MLMKNKKILRWRKLSASFKEILKICEITKSSYKIASEDENESKIVPQNKSNIAYLEFHRIFANYSNTRGKVAMTISFLPCYCNKNNEINYLINKVEFFKPSCSAGEIF